MSDGWWVDAWPTRAQKVFYVTIKLLQRSVISRLGTGTVGLTCDTVPIPVRRKQPLEYRTQNSAPDSCSEGAVQAV